MSGSRREFLRILGTTATVSSVLLNLDHPLDPMREKQGWTQDAQNMFETAAYLTDVAALYRKWWRDWADAQQPDGLLGSVVPVVGRQVHDWNCPWWSGVLVLLPWQHYLHYGDGRILEEAYEPMRRYVDCLGFLAGTGAGRRPLDYPDPHRDVDADAGRRKMLIWIGAGDWRNPTRSSSIEVSAQTPLLVGGGDWATLMHDGVLSEDWHGGGAQMPSCGGAPGMWLYQSVLGIRPDPAGPGFRKFILAPQPDAATGLTSARGSYQSVHGTIESEWTYSDGQFTLRALVPANTSATIHVPAEAAETATESGRPATHSAGVRFLRMERDAAVYEVGSGTYVFRANWVSR